MSLIADFARGAHQGPITDTMRRRLLIGVGAGLAAGISASSADATGRKSAGAVSETRIKRHHVVFQVDSSDEVEMRHAVSGSINLSRYYASKNEELAVEIVANASGIAMFRSDSSPIISAIPAIRALIPGIVLSVCGSSKAIAEHNEGHVVSLLGGVKVVPYGVGRLVDLQEAGWSYIHA